MSVLTLNSLRALVDEKRFIDISGEPRGLNGPLAALVQDEGYVVTTIKIVRSGGSRKSTVKILMPPGTTKLELLNNKGLIYRLDS